MAKGQAHNLATAVVRGFMRAGFTAQDMLQGQIVHTDLVWQAPPLASEAKLDGYTFSDYTGLQVKVDVPAALKLYHGALAGLYAAPSTVCTLRGYNGLSQVLPHASLGERQLRFAVPTDFPHYYAWSGHVFAIEMASLLATSAPLHELTTTGDNYWVRVEGGEAGIRDGMVIGCADWTESAAGFVDSLLSGPRGIETATCDYDVIAKVRSLLHENESMFDEFEGMDLALQTLRILSQGRLCSELLDSIKGMAVDGFENKRRITVIDEALEMLSEWQVNDRIKLGSLYDMLVPDVYSVAAFHANIFNMSRVVPVSMTDSTIKRINTNLLKKRAELMTGVSAADRPSLERA